jgi:hypothetical protein
MLARSMRDRGSASVPLTMPEQHGTKALSISTAPLYVSVCGKGSEAPLTYRAHVKLCLFWPQTSWAGVYILRARVGKLWLAIVH